MKNKFIAILLVMSLLLVMMLSCSCNKQVLDVTYTFNYAYVVWPDGTAEKLKIKSWKDYDGEQIQIKTDSGTYVFHSSNCVLGTK